MAFMNIMKQDCRIKSVSTPEETTHFVWNIDNKLYKIEGLYEGGCFLCFLNFNFADVQQCFHGFSKTVSTQTCKYVSSQHSRSLLDVVTLTNRNLNPSVNVTPKANANEVSILHLNKSSISNKLQDLEALAYGLDSFPAITCLTETHLENNDESHTFAVPGYNEVQVNHRNRYGGGVMIQVHSRATLIKTFETLFEAIFA